MKNFSKLGLIIYFCVITTLSITACVAKDMFPLPGNTIADVVLQKDTFYMIYSYTKAMNKSCKNISVNNTQVTIQPTIERTSTGKIASAYWKELWSVNYCGQNKDFPIDFKYEPQRGGTTYNVDFTK